MENTSAIALFLALGIIIICTRLAGSIARYFGQARVLGELVIGVILGPTLLDLLHLNALGFKEAHLDETIQHLAEIGVLLLMFKIGLDIHFSELAQVKGVAVVAGILGAVLPVVFTMPALMLLDFEWQPSLFAGVTLAATSVSISAQVLLELRLLNTKVGYGLLATALIDDVVAILLVSLSVILTSPETEVNAASLVVMIVRMALYIGLAGVVTWFVIPRLMYWVHSHPLASHSFGVPAVALAIALFFGWSAEALGGIAAITGAFIAGAGLSQTMDLVKHQVDRAVDNITYAFLVPIFFVSVGLQTDLSNLSLDAIPLSALLLFIAVVTKVVGCGAGAYSTGFDREQALQLGVCMVSRGEVGLIIISLGLSSGVFERDGQLYGSLFLVILLTTLVTPLLIRRLFRLSEANSEIRVN